MKKTIYRIFTPVAVFCVLLASCSNPEGDLKRAEQLNTEQAYGDFIKKHPDSPLVAQAQAELEKLAYAAAKQAASADALKRFLQRFPKSSLITLAQAGLEAVEFANASAHPTINGWREFLKAYPQSPNREAAVSNLCRLSFEASVNENTVTALEAFLTEFPSSQRTSTALERLAPLVWKSVKETNTTAACEAFLARFGATSAATEASNALARLQYAVATKDNSIESYESFLRKFPQSQFSDDAQKRLEDQLDERDWNQALLMNTPDTYLDFNKKHPASHRVKVFHGPVRSQVAYVNNGNGMELHAVVSIDGQRYSLSDAETHKWRFFRYEKIDEMTGPPSPFLPAVTVNGVVEEPVVGGTISEATVILIRSDDGTLRIEDIQGSFVRQ